MRRKVGWPQLRQIIICRSERELPTQGNSFSANNGLIELCLSFQSTRERVNASLIGVFRDISTDVLYQVENKF